jgi:hypothetical protein
MINATVITLDTDWAPDFILSFVADILTKKNIKATWFITNNSPYLEKLKKNHLFELGIHPNFELNSTQGKDPNSVMTYLKKIVPNAKSSRSHSLFQSSKIFLMFRKYGIENDVSLFLPNTIILQPHYLKFAQLYRFPFRWEDDIYLMENNTIDIDVNKIPGLNIFNFHPIHIYLNSNSMYNYEQLKSTVGLNNLSQKNTDKYVNDGQGIRTFFSKLLDSLETGTVHTIMELQSLYNKSIISREKSC